MSNVRGKVAVVTGGSRGIGFAIAHALVDRGANVVITGTKEPALARAARDPETRESSPSVLSLRGDVCSYDDVEKVMEAAAVLPHLRARGGGWIINISSLASKNSFADGAAYCASKAGLNAFTESLMQEVRHEGIRVACVMPGSVRTEFTRESVGHDEWKLAPDDVATVVVELLEHPARSLPSRVEIRPARPPKKG